MNRQKEMIFQIKYSITLIMGAFNAYSNAE
jgi:hypothetical protein